MCIDKTESNKRIYPRKFAPKLKHQKLDKQNLTGKKYYGKGCECWRTSTQGHVVRSFNGTSGEWKWCWWVKSMGEGGKECFQFWLQVSSPKATTCCFCVWAIRNRRFWVLLSLPILPEKKERLKLLACLLKTFLLRIFF